MTALDTPVTSTALPRSLLRGAAGIVGVGWLGDFLFWGAMPGLSVGLFAAVLGFALCLAGPRTKTAWGALALLLLSCVQSAVELSLSNLIAIGSLLTIILGETAFPQLGTRWGRWSEALWALLTGCGRWVGLVRVCAESKEVIGERAATASDRGYRALQAGLPALLIGAVFLGLLASGNAVLAEGLSRCLAHLAQWLLGFSFVRTVFWILCATAGLAIFWPAQVKAESHWWQRSVGRWSRSDVTMARWQCGLVLPAVNGIFFLANTADAVFLWAHATLPAGVNHSRFVHEGVQALILAVILAAGVLALVFQHEEAVSGARAIKSLALVWVAQNLVLMWSVAIRLRIYVEAYQLSELRVYVGCFLALVAVGFVQIAWHILKRWDFRRLLVGNLASTLVLFFVLQFVDVGTWVGQWNVMRWNGGEGKALDLAYLESLGHHGWSGLIAVAMAPSDSPERTEARRQLELAAHQNALPANWRSIQVRLDRRLRMVQGAVRLLGQ